MFVFIVFFFFSSRRRHTRFSRDWSSDVCSSDLLLLVRGRRCTIRSRLPDLTQVAYAFAHKIHSEAIDARPVRTLRDRSLFEPIDEEVLDVVRVLLDPDVDTSVLELGLHDLHRPTH